MDKLNIEFGDLSIYKMLNNPKKNDLYYTYSLIIDSLLDSKLWSKNETKAPRIPWQLGKIIRKEQKDIFSKSGIYLWGAGRVPLYIGKTKQSFSKRFDRYIWSKKSQCNLALKYESDLISKGLNGFPNEVTEWYQKNYSGSARLRGAVAFSKYGLNTVWFALFPAEEPSTIDNVERNIIPIANDWNIRNGLTQLLNIEFN